ncbi:DUF4363 family protein [uncultured Clostridium sp.]|uniref:DUF4363 family protein n=1 Tax=uncultured Clostridium sp. TaxID=59620 RepID=UPI0025F93318|nr:DUF4363 family protein [uncultured Clostridium sp.]
MKSLITTLLIFASLLGFVYYANNTLIELCDNITENSITIEELIKENNWSEARDNTQYILNLIDKKTVISSVYINHSDFDDLTDEAIELSIYIDCEDSTESLIAVNSLKNFAKNIKHLHQTHIENIF